MRCLIHDWSLWARDKQLPPEGAWRTWLLMAGRGFGKTRSGAEWVRQIVLSGTARHIGLVGATADDARFVMVEGPSGLLSIGHPEERPVWRASLGRLDWRNGARAQIFSAEKPGQLRGPEFDHVWADEVAKWRYEEAWSNVMMCLRLGPHPRALATTTPLPKKWLIDVPQAPDTKVVIGSTAENRRNLAPGFFEAMKSRLGSTGLIRQELEGVLLAEQPDALFTRQQLDAVTLMPPKRRDLVQVVIGVDPAVGGRDETGIIIAGREGEGLIWVLDDLSCHAPPDEWARIVVTAAIRWRADAILAEVNQGGDLVRSLLAHQPGCVPIRTARALKDKRSRALPVAAAYARSEVAHGAPLTALVDQMVTFVPGLPGMGSPDRLDALVWAVSGLLSGLNTTTTEFQL